MVSQFNIRPMTFADAQSVGEVGFAAWSGNLVLNSFGVEMSERVRQAFHDFPADNVTAIVVAETDGKIVGWTARDGEPDYISDLWVAPDHQGRGVGRALLEHAFLLMKREGIKMARIATHAGNSGAIRLYERCGFNLVWQGLEHSQAMQMDVEKVRLERPL
ncbi:GNAT family N-acetyltransferase [Rhizobium sp. SL42]|uniref:GNAT family N-acetyltransferase n=1 Tax=Rhizobium sp. SL42 TaxID=2806346 RepID=UPI0030168724